MEYSFNSKIAEDYQSADISIIVKNFDYWLSKNIANDKHNYEGRTWTYNSSKAFEKLFPWLSSQKIARLLRKMEDLGIIEVGNFNDSPYDRTKWFTFTDEFCLKYKNELKFSSLINFDNIDCLKLNNGACEIEQPIPDSKPNSKPNTIPDFKIFIEKFNEKKGSKFKETAKSRSSFQARKKEGFTLQDILSAVNNCLVDDFHRENPQYLTPEFILRPDKLQKYLNAKPRGKPKIRKLNYTSLEEQRKIFGNG